MEPGRGTGFSTAPKHRQVTGNMGKIIITKPNHQPFGRAVVNEHTCGVWDTGVSRIQDSPLKEKVTTASSLPWWRRLPAGQEDGPHRRTCNGMADRDLGRRRRLLRPSPARGCWWLLTHGWRKDSCWEDNEDAAVALWGVSPNLRHAGAGPQTAPGLISPDNKQIEK